LRYSVLCVYAQCVCFSACTQNSISVFVVIVLFLIMCMQVYADPRAAEEESRLWSLLFVAISIVAAIAVHFVLLCLVRPSQQD